ncbi:glutathione S-transferase 1-like [Chironomus tepperi]|uniref:glutathione S-transferase 1-like n=1 Tax=Chironomus tepperi TaxID=113505 RepID=UPI00391F9FF8
MGKPNFYFTPDSPPCQAVTLVIKQLKLEVTYRPIDLEKNEHLTPEFLALNPLHQVPTLDDKGFIIGDSHAIIQYLATGSNLTSLDPHVLARINQAMYFDFELFRVMGEIGHSLFFETRTEPSQKAVAVLYEKLGALEQYLQRRNWVAGEFLTIADFSIFATFSAIYNCPIDLSKFESILKWHEKCKKTFIGYPSIKEDSKNALGNFLKSKGIKLELKIGAH